VGGFLGHSLLLGLGLGLTRRRVSVTHRSLQQSMPVAGAGGRRRRLGAADVHVWVAASDGLLPPPEALGDELSPGDLAESRRFKFEMHRRRFLATRLLRRRVLADYLGTRPGLLVFHFGAKGKPELAAMSAGNLSFNETESDGVAVVAVARGRRLGVDIERLHSVPEAESIVSGFGSDLEKHAFASLSPEDRQDLFLRWWTGKEAFVKALGEGLSMPLADFSILVSAGGRVELAGEDGWSLQTLEPAPGYVGALVAEGRRPRLSMRVWENGSA
jgi:4'-phosphopantetheinyl transferase